MSLPCHERYLSASSSSDRDQGFVNEGRETAVNNDDHQKMIPNLATTNSTMCT